VEHEEDKQSLLVRLRDRHAWLDHILRAGERYVHQYGDHYAAAITYYSVLSLVPLLMLGFSIAGFVLVGNNELLDQLKTTVATVVPGALGTQVDDIVGKLIASRGSVGILGLLAALYSGLGWMTSIRDALTAQWNRERQQLPLVRTALRDLGLLIVLGLALVVSFGLTFGGSKGGQAFLDLIGLGGTGWAVTTLAIVSIALSLIADWLVFVLVLSQFPRYRVEASVAIRGAILGAVGFEILKQIGNIYLNLISGSPAGTVFGSILRLLVFVNLVARLVVFITAWTATATKPVVVEDDHSDTTKETSK